MNHASADNTRVIDVADLQVGMFVHLEGGWMSHPFPLSRFRITSAEQLATIRGLGLPQVRWVPAASEGVPADAADGAPGEPAAALSTATLQAAARAISAAQRHRDAVAADRERLQACERQFDDATKTAKRIFETADAQPQAAAASAQALVGDMADQLLGAADVSIRVLGEMAGDKAALHAVNVGLVSLLLGRAVGLGGDELRELGVGALLHDIGKAALPARLRHRDDRLTAAEQRGYEEHVARGVLQGRRMGLGSGALQAIAQHHEQADGSGFPQGVGSDRISTAASIVALVDRYDNLCNPHVGARAVTPHEAVALLFAQRSGRFDAALLNAFIRMMGVYPPGSTVQLTDSRFALVVSVNSLRPLKPRVLVHEPGVPRHEALTLDLERQSGLGVLRSIKPQALPPLVREYLAPRARVSYFFEPEAEAEAVC